MKKNMSYKKIVIFAIVVAFILGAFMPAVGPQIGNSVSHSSEKNGKISIGAEELVDVIDGMKSEGFGTKLSEDNTVSDLTAENQENIFPLDIGDPWWNPNWEYRKEITIDHSKVDTSLSNLPVLVSISSDNNLSNPAQCQIDGDDIAFTDKNGNQLNHEIEFFDNDTGELIAWVNVTTLSSSIDTVLYMYYGNAGASNQQNPSGVWDSYYVIVQHLNETSGTHFDSTSLGNDGTPVGGVNQDVVGVVDGADSFDGVDGYVNVADDDSLSFGDGSDDDPFTVGAWVYMDSAVSTQRFVCKADSLSDGEYILSTTGASLFTFSVIDQSSSGIIGRTYSVVPSSDQWYYLIGTYDGSGSTSGIKLYVDGVRVDDGDLTSGIYTAMENSAKPLYFGKYGSNYLDGIVDEVRISKLVRNAAWINTSYLNQHDPSSFYSVGSEESSGSPTVSDPIPADSAISVSINLENLTFTLNDYQGDSMTYYVETDPDIGSGSATVGNGTYNVSVSGLTYSTVYIWYVNVTDGTYWTNKTYTFTTEFAPAGWWDTGWPFRKGIVIDSSLVASDLVNFPVLFSEVDSDLVVKAQGDGDDIVFTDYYGERLSHEIEYYNGSSGELVVWVNVTSLSSTVDTILYMYYGNSSCSSQENITGVWYSDYVMVQHLSETSGTHFDSTSLGNDGTPVGGVNQDVVGIVDGADSFDGVDGYVNVSDDDSLSFGDGSIDGPFTVGAWVYMDSDNSKQRFVGKADARTDGEYLLTTSGPGNLALFLYDQSSGDFIGRTYSTLPTLDQWYHLVGTYNGSSSTSGIKLYLDGERVDDTDSSQGSYVAMENSAKPLYFGKYGSNYLDGLVDEVRISNLVRNASWINTSYLNQYDPSSFYSVGSEESYELNNVILTSPLDETLSNWTVNFSFIPIFYEPIQKAELYINESGIWDVVETIDNVTSNITNIITHTVSHSYPYPEEGTYTWNVKVWNSTNGVFAASNSTVTIDIPPRWRNAGSNTTTPLEGEPVSLYSQGYDSIGLDSAWLATNESGEWVNYTDTIIVGSGNGSIEWNDPSCTTQRGILYKGKMYDTECGSLYIRNWSTMTVLDTHALGGYTNTAPCLDLTNEEIVYVSCSNNGKVIGYNTTSKNEIWSRTFTIPESGPRDIDARCLYLDDGYLFVLLCNFTIYKLDKTDGTTAGVFYLDYGDVGDKGTRMYSVDAEENRIYGVGYAKFHCINSTDMTEIWNASVPDGSGSEGNSVPMVVKEDGFYRIYFGTVLDPWEGSDNSGYVHCFDYDGNEIWNKSIDGGIHSHMAYNPLTEYVYANDFFEYAGSQTNHIYALNRSTGEEIWNVTGPRGDHFVRRVEFVGNVGMFHTDNGYGHGGGEYFYLFNADDGSFFGEIPYSGESLCNLIISEGKAVIGGVNGLIRFDLGIGEYVDYKYLYGNYRTGYTDANALIAYGSSFTYEPAIYGSPIDLGGVSDTWVWTNFTWQNDSIPAGTTINWRIYYNDTYGHVNATDVHSFTVRERTEPFVFDPVPADDAVNVPVSLSMLNVTIEDPQGDSFNWTIETSPVIGNSYGNNELNGTKICSISGLSYDTVYKWFVNTTDGNGYWTNKTFTFTTEIWWDTGWLFRKEIVINSSLVVSDLVNFPVLFSEIDSDFPLKTQDDGDDIAFTDINGIQLSHEIEFFNNSSGELVAWVNVTSLSSTVDTLLYMYYGNSSCSSQENITGVWDSDYVIVQHLNETSGTHFDSTSYGNNGSINGGVNQNVVGVVDGADSFDGVDGYVNVADADSLSFGDGSNDDPFTVGAWVYIDSNVIKQRFVCKANSLSDGEYILSTTGASLFTFSVIDQSEGAVIGRTYSSIPSTGQWYYLVGTYNGTGSTNGIKLYLDGIRVDDGDLTSGTYTAMENSAKPLYFGKYGSDYLDGLVDEVRISKGVRSAGWVKTSFNTMNNTSGFVSVGVEETWEVKEEYKIILADNWNLISLPFNESINKTDITVSYDGENITWVEAVDQAVILNYIYGWNRSSDIYNTYDTLDPGYGYWVWSYHDDVDLLLSSDITGDGYITALQQEWCIMGLPYNTSLAKEDLIVHYNTTDYSWYEATTDNNEEGEPLILQYIYGWYRNSQEYFLSDTLDPDQGYWMYTFYSCILKKETI